MMIPGTFVTESTTMLMGNIYGWKITVNGPFRTHMHTTSAFNEGDTHSSSSTSNFVGARMYWAIELTGCYRHFNFDEAIWMGCWTPIHNPLSLEPTRPEFVIIKLQDTFETRFRFQQRNKFPMQHFREIREHETPCKAGSFFTPLSGGTSVSGDTWSRKRKSWIYKKLYVNLRSPKGETIWTSKTPLTEPQKMEVKTFTLNTVGHIRSNQNRTNLSATLPGWMCTVS